MNLAAAAERAPQDVAIRFEGRSTSYSELTEAAAAHGRTGLDVFRMPNTPDSVARFHGTLRRGGVCVPLNPLLSEREIAERSVRFEPRHGTAVVLYTSGTTGTPKRIELTHETLERNASYLAQALGFRRDDVVFGSAPLSHVFGMTGCMNATIAAGACLALIPRFDARAALETIEREVVTVFMGVPAMLADLVHASTETGHAPELRLAHVGGAPLPPETLRTFEERFGATVFEGYGMTEVGGAVTVNHADRPRKPGSVGQAAAGQTVEIAADGEVIVDGLATGDVGRIDDDGYLFLLDRKKHIILRGGYTVYPREVEDVLCLHPHVREAAVIGIPDERLGEEIAAFVVGDPQPDELQRFARERLAAYKYPRRITVVAELPRSATGKVLRDALR